MIINETISTQRKIIGTGSYVPETIYTNKYLESIIDTNAEWIEKT